MKFLFADESVSKINEFMVFTGFYYDADNFKIVEDKLKEVCKNFKLESFEQIKNKKIDRQTRELVNKKISEILSETNSKIISIIIPGKQKDISYVKGMHLFTERLFLELKKINDYCIIFYDEDKSRESVIKKSLSENNKIIKIGNKFYLNPVPLYISQNEIKDRVILLLFLDEKECFSIQVASIICGAVEKALTNLIREKKEFSSNHIEKLDDYFYALKAYFHLFSRNKEGKIYGYGIKDWRENYEI